MAFRKQLIILVVFLFPIVSSANYCVSGAGSTIVNGYYEQGADLYGAPAYYPIDGQDTVMEYGLSNYYEIRSLSNVATQGYYHDSAGAGGSYTGIDTVNNIGVAPVPTVVVGYGDCDIPSTSTPSLASSTAQTYGDWLFMSSVQTFLLSFIAIGMLFSLFKVKR